MALLASVAYWGFSEQTGAVQWVLGLGAPLLLAVVFAGLVRLHLSLTFALGQRPR
jgi:hypothetical protein